MTITKVVKNSNYNYQRQQIRFKKLKTVIFNKNFMIKLIIQTQEQNFKMLKLPNVLKKLESHNMYITIIKNLKI